MKAKHCLVLSTNFLYSKVCWQHPAMFWLYIFPSHNLNFHWRWRWWDQIQAIFLNLFYFNCLLVCKKGFLCSSSIEKKGYCISVIVFLYFKRGCQKSCPWEKKSQKSQKCKINLVKLPFSAQKLLLRKLFFVMIFNPV